MVKKIIHTGDWHIRTMRMHREYKETFKIFFSDVTDLVKGYEREEVRIVVAGDLVHNKTVISNEQLILATWVLSELEKIAPVIIIAGNHDLNLNNKDRMDSITPMVQFLPDANINYFKESKCYMDDNIVWCVYSIFEDNERPDIEGARLEFGDDKTYIGLFHGPLIGSSTDIGYEIEHGYGLDIFDSCDIVMCADIHKRQKITYKDIPVVFCSSLIQQNFGENITKHGFLCWDVETKTFTEHDVDNRFAYYQFKIKSLEDIESGNEQLTNL
jgi:DNA repair exonuclease SbcCD nuclease subunit